MGLFDESIFLQLLSTWSMRRDFLKAVTNEFFKLFRVFFVLITRIRDRIQGRWCVAQSQHYSFHRRIFMVRGSAGHQFNGTNSERPNISLERKKKVKKISFEVLPWNHSRFPVPLLQGPSSKPFRQMFPVSQPDGVLHVKFRLKFRKLSKVGASFDSFLWPIPSTSWEHCTNTKIAKLHTAICSKKYVSS